MSDEDEKIAELAAKIEAEEDLTESVGVDINEVARVTERLSAATYNLRLAMRQSRPGEGGTLSDATVRALNRALSTVATAISTVAESVYREGDE